MFVFFQENELSPRWLPCIRPGQHPRDHCRTDEASGGTRQTLQDEMSQEEEQAGNLGRRQGHSIMDREMMLLRLLTMLHANSQLVNANVLCGGNKSRAFL